MTEPVRVTRGDGIATVTLGNRDKLNALNGATWQRLGDAPRALSADGGLRLRRIVVRGAGTSS